jgi:AcrR family transcriptional regulator
MLSYQRVDRGRIVQRESSEARERVLRYAEQIFGERGYAAVTLRDIAAGLGMRQASLYHHVPGGKEALYVEVTERTLRRHHQGLERALADGGGVRAQLRAAARWLLSQPPMNLSRMVRSDLPGIAQAHADRLIATSYETLFAPLEGTLRRAEGRGEIRAHNPILLAAAFVALVEGLWDAYGGRTSEQQRDDLATELIDVLLDGLRPREPEG